jgi:putative porin
MDYMGAAARRLEMSCRVLIGIWLATLAPLVAPSSLLCQVQGQPAATPDWRVFGDFRLRYEDTTQQEPGSEPGRLEPRHRGVIRFRAGVTKKIAEQFTFTGRVATGPRGDPNTTDVTLGEFFHDLEIKLDRVSLDFKHNNLFLTGGKFANPFVRTGFVWDDDVNLQGAGGSYAFKEVGKLTPKFTAVYSIVDEQTLNPDSYMAGGQMELHYRAAPDWHITLTGGYYDYTLKSLVNANVSDIRSNNLTPDRRAYLSDFNLLDAIAMVEYRRGNGHPIQFVGDYFKNLGARVPEDGGFSFDLFYGRATQRKDMRFRYGLAAVETDAVLAAFSHDDTTFATNYKQHTVSFDYVVARNTTLNVTWYYYRRLAPNDEQNDYISRIRLNLMVSF